MYRCLSGVQGAWLERRSFRVFRVGVPGDSLYTMSRAIEALRCRGWLCGCHGTEGAEVVSGG